MAVISRSVPPSALSHDGTAYETRKDTTTWLTIPSRVLPSCFHRQFTSRSTVHRRCLSVSSPARRMEWEWMRRVARGERRTLSRITSLHLTVFHFFFHLTTLRVISFILDLGLTYQWYPPQGQRTSLTNLRHSLWLRIFPVEISWFRSLGYVGSFHRLVKDMMITFSELTVYHSRNP